MKGRRATSLSERSRILGNVFVSSNQGHDGATGMAGRWSEGIWLGIREESGDVMIGTKDGIMKARTIRKASHGQIWNRTRLDEVTATPWHVGKDDQRDEDINIEVPGQEGYVKEVPQRTRKIGPREGSTSRSRT